jgi:putative phosphoesterase
MKRIGLISDTHSYLDEAVFQHFEACDEIWHAGDFGNLELADRLAAFKPLRGVYGNIDGPELRQRFPEQMEWTCEEARVYICNIGGYPPRYTPALKKTLHQLRPALFICGHSHILKVMYDKDLACLHMNPGAFGREGWHQVRTLLRFSIEGKDIHSLEVVEMPR